MKPDLTNQQLLFAFFYIISFAIILVLAIYFSKTRRLPLRSVLLMLTATTFFTVAGSRLFMVPVSQWIHFLFFSVNGADAGRSAIGGIVFGLAGFLISARYCRLDSQVLEFYAWLTPVGFGIQKIGCFFNGCCFGVQCPAFFGVRYPSGTGAHFSQVASGVIDSTAVFSLKVFPVQLFEALVFCLIGYIVWRTREKWRKTGSIILFSLILMFIFRFLSEFLRDPASSGFNGIFLGIRTLQWFLLLTGVTFCLVMILYERSSLKSIRLWKPAELSPAGSVSFILSVTAGMYLFRGIFSNYEKLALWITFIPSVILTMIYFMASLREMKMKIATSFLVLPFIMILPTLEQDTLKKVPAGEGYFGKENTYTKIDAGTSFGKLYSTVFYNPHEGYCGETYTTEDYEHLFSLAGGGYSKVKNMGTHLLTTGINVFGGKLYEHNLTNQWYNSSFIGGINPVVKYDAKWYGIGAGMNVGDLKWINTRFNDDITLDKGTNSFFIMPEIYARLGRPDIIDIRYSFGSNSYATFPVLISEVSLGTGFGKRTGYGIRIGFKTSQTVTYGFTSGEFLLKQKVGLNFRFDFPGYSDYYYPQYKSKGIFTLGASYRLDAGK